MVILWKLDIYTLFVQFSDYMGDPIEFAKTCDLENEKCNEDNFTFKAWKICNLVVHIFKCEANWKFNCVQLNCEPEITAISSRTI